MSLQLTFGVFEMNATLKKLLAAAGLVAVAGVALAGSDATFATIFDTLNSWATGSLGKVISIAMFIVGLGAGIVKQSVMAVVAGVGAAIVMAYGPGVIDSMFAATV
jgi:conjugal transfer pilus assembly protein TraA